MYMRNVFTMPEDLQTELLMQTPTLNLITSDLSATLLPFYYDPASHTVNMHVAKANPQAQLENNTRALAIIDGIQGYIRPGYYASKQEHGKVVPTWDYASLHLHGHITLITDNAWLHPHINTLTHKMEQFRNSPWAVNDAPEKYIHTMMQAIVGIEFHITEIQAKAKFSQDKPESDQTGVVNGLQQDNRADLAEAISTVLVQN